MAAEAFQGTERRFEVGAHGAYPTLTTALTHAAASRFLNESAGD
jgi:hypothetical protein